MKITFVFDGLQFGGIERVGIEYIKLLKSKGYNIEIINLVPSLNDMEKEVPEDVCINHIRYSRFFAPEKYSKLQRRGVCGSVAFFIVSSFLNMLQPFYRLLYTKKLNKCDIAIAFSGHYNDLTFVAKNFKEAKKKIAWLHGDQHSYDEIAPGYYRLYKRIKNLICLSEEGDKEVYEFNQKHGINKVKIYNPVNCDDKIVDPMEVDKIRKNYRDFCLMVARMAPDKDQKTVIKAFSILLNKYGLEKKLVLVGDGPERQSNERYAKELGIDNNVIFSGSRYDVQNFYSAAQIYIHSSPAEGLPTVLLEAMYYNLPIASTDSRPGVREILQDNCGLITDVGDAEALAKSIYDLYTDKELVKELTDFSRARIKAFLPKYVIEQFEKFIN